MKYCVIFLTSFLLIGSNSVSFAQKSNLDGLSFLIGEWTGSGGGPSARLSEGDCVFRYDLDSTVIIRENLADYSGPHKTGHIHKDLMVIYWQVDSPKAIYIDNEQHVINYNIERKENKLILTSEKIKDTPQFRFTYEKLDSNRMDIEFDIAPPNTPDKYNHYISGIMKKK